LGVDWGYNRDLYEAKTAERMMENLCRLLEAVAESADLRSSDIPLLSEVERRQIIEEWNATEREYPWERCVHQLFEEQVERTPEAAAVIYKTKRLTYRELNEPAWR
jgi:non-ribosomal peptide synthetase component F